MAEDQVHRRRRRRRRRRGGGGGGGAAEATGTEASPALADWRWRTFPVFFAFACGALAMVLLIGVVPGLSVILFFGALFGVSFGLAHILTRTVVGRRR